MRWKDYKGDFQPLPLQENVSLFPVKLIIHQIWRVGNIYWRRCGHSQKENVVKYKTSARVWAWPVFLCVGRTSGFNTWVGSVATGWHLCNRLRWLCCAILRDSSSNISSQARKTRVLYNSEAESPLRIHISSVVTQLQIYRSCQEYRELFIGVWW